MFNGLSYNGILTKNTITIMSILFFIWFASFIVFLPELFKKLKNIKKSTLIILFIIFLVGFWLRNSSYKYGMAVDGMYYQEMAKEMYENGVYSQGCSIGTPSNCSYYFSAVVMPGYPFIIDIAFMLFGVRDIFAMIINGIVSSLNIILVFILFYIMFKNEIGALISALIYSFIPGDIFISQTAAVRPTFLFFIMLSIISYFVFIKDKSIIAGIFSVLSLSYSIYVRPEGYLVLALFIIGLFLYRKKFNLRKRWKYILIICLIFLSHQYVALNWLSKNGYGMTGGSVHTFSISNVIPMTPILIKSFFVSPKYRFTLFNPIVSILFFASCIYLFFDKKYKKEFYFIFLWFIIFFVGIASFYQCPGRNITECNEYPRYMQILFFQYALIIGLGTSKIYNIFKSKRNKKIFIISIFIIALTSLFFINIHLSIFRDGRKDEPFVNEYYDIYKNIPENSTVLVSQPQVFNFDFMRNKNLYMMSYESLSHPYFGYRDIFINVLKNRNNIYIIYEGMEPFSDLFNNKNLTKLLYHKNGFRLFEVINKEEFIKGLENLTISIY